MPSIGITGGIATGKSTFVERLRELQPTATFFDADATKKLALEQILHPRIRRQWRTKAKEHRNSPKYFFADIPLLYETGGESLCDQVVVVGCSQKVQLARLRKRMSVTSAQAKQMIISQMPL